MQKFSSLLLALIACAGTIFAERVQIGDLYYNLNADNLTAEVTSMPSGKYTGEVIIPESVEYNSTAYSVTSIGVNAFRDCTSLTSIEIPNTVISIGNTAFYYCTGLTSITIPNSVTSIGDGAFASCTGLTSITIPNSITSIRFHAFSGCTGLTSVNIPQSVTSIEESAFSSCTGLTSITIPNSVTSIRTGAFAYCSGLTSVTNYATTPQTIGGYVFYGVNLSPCTLYVPEGSINLYKVANVWKDFNIQAIDETHTSIDQITNNQTPVANKIIKDGQVVILRGDKTYTVTGQQLK